MLAKNTTAEQAEKALKEINGKYDGNIIFKRFEPNTRSVKFTLTVKSSKGKGGRLGFSGRRIRSACWHVHGDFFEALLKINPSAVIRSGKTKTITKDGGNWQDWNIGSIVSPLYYSDACDCQA